MIVNIRGTSGSGKSTAARLLMDLYETKGKVRIPDRKQPIAYLCGKIGHKTLAVIGHYETDCGGTDTINGMDEIYKWVRDMHDAGYDVLFEGLLSSAEKNRAIQLHEDGYPLTVLHIDIPLDECIASVEKRRQNAYERKLGLYEAGQSKTEPKPPKPLNPKNTESKWKGTRTTMQRLTDAGIECHSGDRDDVLAMARQLLNV